MRTARTEERRSRWNRCTQVKTSSTACPSSFSSSSSGVNSLMQGRISLPWTSIPQDLTCSSITGSNSSTTISLSTPAANSRMRFSQRIDRAQFQYRGFRHDFLNVLVGYTAGDNANLTISPFDTVHGTVFHIFGQSCHPFFDFYCVTGQNQAA